MHDSPSPSRRVGARVTVVAIGTLAGAVALLTACGGGSAGGASTTGKRPPSSATANANSNGGAADRPAASGKIAEIDGNTLQVQSDDSGQVAVTVNDKTTYLQTKAATLSAIRVGSCIVATSPTSNDKSSTTQPTAITADEITVTSAVNGSCTRGLGGDAGGGNGPRGSSTGVPSNFQRPSDAPSGADGQLRRALGTAGVVTAVHGNTITVKSERREFPASATPSTSASATTTTVTVTVSVTVTSATKYTATVSATKAALKVGLCLTATGTTGSDGAVSAQRVSLGPATSGACGQTLRRGFAGGGPGRTVTSGG